MGKFMNYKTISEKIHNSVQTISLNRPDRLNAWTEEMAVEIKKSMQDASNNTDVKVIVLTGTGRGFCAGADMEELNKIDADERAEQNTTSPYSAFDSTWPLDFQRAQTWFPSVPKPIIAAINGPAAGLGLILSMWCDIRFASKSAIFSTAFSKRGLVAEHGISWLLPRLVGIGHAMDMTLSARKISADEAEKIGFVNKTFSDEIFLEEVYKYAESLANNVSPRSMKVIKRQLWQGLLLGLNEAVAIADNDMVDSFSSEDFKEGVAHFIEKRAPNFSGK
jgi:enoyl-CoA hydratase/carnithine racemase